MSKPERHANHVLDSKAKKFLEQHIPDEWIYNIPSNDYGLDYQVEICLNRQVTGLNFSIQLKGHIKGNHKNYAKAILKHSTISYYKVRLEPIMIVVYEDDSREAYWSWLNDLDIDLSKGRKEYVIKVPKANVLRELEWNDVVNHVQLVFSNKSFLSDFDISKIHNDVELAAWKVYYDGNYDQAVYLFKELIEKGSARFSIFQALSWSLFETYRYPEALTLVNGLISQKPTDNLLQMKACILAEFGISSGDKGKIIQARDLFKRSLTNDASNIVYYNYGNTLSALGEYQEAIKQFRLSLKKESFFAQCWKNLGTALGNVHEHDEELKCYKTALSINPDLLEALFSLGIALAKDYRQYKEALHYFEKALSTGKTNRPGYISGLFWVAECYRQTGDLKKALYWTDYGLNFEGDNPFLLNLKTSILAEHWRTEAELKAVAAEFFNYRIELSHHGESLYHLIEIKGWTLEEAFPVIQEHSPLLRNVSLSSLVSIGFDLEMIRSTLLNLERLAEYKKEYKATRYINDLINGLYSIGPEFYDLFDVISGYAFNKFIMTYEDTGSDIQPSKVIFDIMTEYVPKLIPFLVQTNKKFLESEHDAVRFFIYNGLYIITMRETGALSGYLNVRLGLRKVDPSEYITEDKDLLLTYKLLVTIVNYLEPDKF